MTRPHALWGLAALLACAVAAELAWPAPEAEAPPVPRPAAAAAARPVRLADEAADWTAALLARPPFATDRRPAAGAAVAAAGPAAPLPRLAGILVNGADRSALFATDGGRAVVAREGAKLGAFAVRSIRTDGVLVDGPDGPLTLRPSYAKLDATQQPPPPPNPAALPWTRGRMPPPGPSATLLPPLPSTDTTPFSQMVSPSGASIFGNAPPQGRLGR